MPGPKLVRSQTRRPHTCSRSLALANSRSRTRRTGPVSFGVTTAPPYIELDIRSQDGRNNTSGSPLRANFFLARVAELEARIRHVFQQAADESPGDPLKELAERHGCVRGSGRVERGELGPGEPAAGPWRMEQVDVFARSLAAAAGTPIGRPRIIVDVAVWVQSDVGEAKRRGLDRDMAELGRDEDEALRLWDEWEAEEVPFLLADQPWRRARCIVGTALSLPHDAETQVVVSAPLR